MCAELHQHIGVGYLRYKVTSIYSDRWTDLKWRYVVDLHVLRILFHNYAITDQSSQLRLRDSDLVCTINSRHW